MKEVFEKEEAFKNDDGRQDKENRIEFGENLRRIG